MCYNFVSTIRQDALIPLDFLEISLTRIKNNAISIAQDVLDDSRSNYPTFIFGPVVYLSLQKKISEYSALPEFVT